MIICLLFSRSLSYLTSFLYSPLLISTLVMILLLGMFIPVSGPSLLSSMPSHFSAFLNTTHLRISFLGFTFVIKLPLTTLTSGNLFLSKLFFFFFFSCFLASVNFAVQLGTHCLTTFWCSPNIKIT